MIIVACITFGHNSEDIARALAPAIAEQEADNRVRVISVDDASGRNHAAEGVTAHVTPSRRGFPGVVQYIVETLYPESSRLILINPDASLDRRSLRTLIETNSDVAVPRILDAGAAIENVRQVTTAAWELRNLAFGEKYRGRLLSGTDTVGIVACPPYAPSGAVISLNALLLRERPLNPDYFWLEFSEWVLRQPGSVTLSIEPVEAQHLGGSTSVKYPLSVAASQARAKFLFIRSQGSRLDRICAVPALASRGVRVAIKRRSVFAGVFVLLAGMGLKDWRIAR